MRVAEDNPVNLLIVCALLERLGAQALGAVPMALHMLVLDGLGKFLAKPVAEQDLLRVRLAWVPAVR